MDIKTQFYNNLNKLENAKFSNSSIDSLNYNELYNVLTQSGEKSGISADHYFKYKTLLDELFPISPVSNTIIDDQTTEEAFDKRNSISKIREGNEITIDGKKINKISTYKFKILVKDKPAFEGELSRTEMEIIHKLYSSEGANVAIKSLSREFPQYTQQQLKKILRAFTITKACSPLAPHIVEEMNTEDAIDFSIRLKENLIAKKVEDKVIRHNEQRVKELSEEILKLKNKQTQLKNILGEINYPNNPIKFSFKSSSKTLIISLSDIHVGAAVSTNSIYYNEWNEEELNERFKLIIKSLSKFEGEIDNIVVFNLGDSLDGYKGETTRGGHLLPQNMNDKEQVKVFIRQMLQFFDNLYATFEVPMSYYCVGESNHDGDYGWLANEKLASMLEVKYPDMVVEIFDKFMDFVDINGTMFVLTHGKEFCRLYEESYKLLEGNIGESCDANTEIND